MWYQIGIRKDGSVTHCEVSSDSIGANSSKIVYVEANSKEEAIAKAKADWIKWRERKLSTAKARGLCQECFARPAKDKCVRCQTCLTKRAKRKVADRARAKLPDYQRQLLDPTRLDDIRLNRKISMEIGSAIGNQIRSSVADEKLDRNGLKPQAYTPSTLLRYVARAYDRDPENFREWLEGQIESMTGIFSRENRAQA